ncbi:siphovirus Gp157 family protein [Staphylococcus simulans]|uniref:siphovirus Gp157 family protein n=1 Tax=Staphylococcus simulans TaxID=1286 RepID=UPI0018EBE674|nr:siphovirus Gp157 family protein [Staphylococcus simulans]
MVRLFDLTESYQQVYDLIAEEGDEKALVDTLESIEDAFEDKADGYQAVIKSLEADNVAIDEEIKRLRQRKTTNQNGIKRLKESLQEAMLRTDKIKFKTALHSYSIANNPPSLDIETEKYIPTEYWVSQAPKVNKKDLLADLKNGKEIKGVTVKQTQSLRVR